MDSYKPKLVFFQSRYDDNLPEFLLAHKQEHVNCLSLFFDVTVIRHDCDYEQICDLYQPDLALFESGVNLLTCRRPKIANVRSCRIIPKLGLLNADAWCETRSGSLSEMDQWGIETFFSISTTAAEHMPAVADRLFIWPNSIDATVYHKYNEAKLIPVLLSGATAAQYPWRRRVYKLVAEHYPSLWCPHRGYLSRSSAGQVLSGVKYARTISAAEVAPVCGTVAKEVIRKHFEIPACGTCLITEPACNLEQAGFVDMTNCVFADEHNILDKLEFLFTNPERLREITAAGHQLVHTRHTQQNRNQILQWFHLNKTIASNEKIIQLNPFVQLTTTSGLPQKSSPSPVEIGTHLQLLRKGDEMLWAGQIAAAESQYQRCLSYMQKLPEARFKLALCNLYKGNAAEASSGIFELIQYCVSEYQAVDPDPVEWAYYLLSLLGMGKLIEADNFASEFPWLEHPELNRVRMITHLLSGAKTGRVLTFGKVGNFRDSIHQLPEKSEMAWHGEFIQIMLACGQPSLAEAAARLSLKPEHVEKGSHDSITTSRPAGYSDESLELSGATQSKATIDISRSKKLERKLVYFKARRKLRGVNATVSRFISQATSYLFPIPQTRDADTQFVQTVRDLARDSNIKSVLIVGSSATEDVTRAIWNGTAGADKVPLICCVCDSKDLPTVNGGDSSTQQNMN
jgi:Glycosyl transferases group 1